MLTYVARDLEPIANPLGYTEVEWLGKGESVANYKMVDLKMLKSKIVT